MKATETMINEILSAPSFEWMDEGEPIAFTNTQLAELFIKMAQTIDAMQEEIQNLTHPERVPFGDGEMGQKVLDSRAKKLTTKNKVLNRMGLK